MVWIAPLRNRHRMVVDPGGGSMDPADVAFTLEAAACSMAYIYLGPRLHSLPGRLGARHRDGRRRAVVLPAGIVKADGEHSLPDLLGSALVVALLSSVLPYSLELEALRRLPESVFGVLMSVDPAVAALIGFVLLGQASVRASCSGSRWWSWPAPGRLASVIDDNLAGTPRRAAGALRAARARGLKLDQRPFP